MNRTPSVRFSSSRFPVTSLGAVQIWLSFVAAIPLAMYCLNRFVAPLPELGDDLLASIDPCSGPTGNRRS